MTGKKSEAAMTSNIPHIFEDRMMNLGMARTVGYEAYGGAAYGECNIAAHEVEGGSRDSWQAAWSKLGTRLRTNAEDALADGHKATAQARFMRAFNYFRAAEFFINPTTPDKEQMFRKSQDCFNQSMKLLDHPAEKIEVPYLDTTLPCFYWQVADDGKKRPTVILHGGGDGSGEELYLMGGVAALRRGYNVISFEGPGQRGFLYDNPNHPYRPDYEEAIRPIVDWALAQPTVDADKLALYAISFGGYTGTRAAATDDRIKAFVVNAPLTDFYGLIVQSFQAISGQDMEESELVENVIKFYEAGVAGIQFAVDQLYWILGTKTLPETLEKMKEFRLNGIEANIKCPILCLYAEAEGEEGKRQLDEFLGNVTAPCDVHVFDELSGANSHCMLPNYVVMYEVLFDWLDDQFGQ